MPTYHTVVPLHHVYLKTDTAVEFGAGLTFGPMPAWIFSENQTLMKSLSEGDQEAIKQSRHAFVITYEAASLGDPDPDNPGKSVQESKYELCVMANFALWLSKPSPLCFAIVVHAPQFGSEPAVQQINRLSEILCHPNNVDDRVTATDLPLAQRLHVALTKVNRNSAVFTATRAAWAGMQLNSETVRYALFWIALEALFGPDDGREITYRLSQRVGFFLGENRTAAKDLFKLTKQGYSFRSKIVHGRWGDDPNSTARMAETETLLRRSLIRILEDKNLAEKFSGNTREAFLDELAFQN